MGTGKNNASGRRRGKGASKNSPSQPSAGTGNASGKFNSTTQPWLFLISLIAGLLLLATLMLYEEGQPFFGDGNPPLWGDSGCLQRFVRTTDSDLSNPTGKLGATVAVVAFNMFGLSAFMLPVFLFLFSYYMARYRADISLPWKGFLMFFALCSGATLLEILPSDLIGFGASPRGNPYMPSGPGGALGAFLFGKFFLPFLGLLGSACLLSCVYFFCVLGLLVSAPQKTIAGVVNWFFEGAGKYFENRRRWREHQARQREAQRKAYLAAQEQLRKNREAAEMEAAEKEAAAAAAADFSDEKNAAPEESPEEEDDAAAAGVPAEFSGAETEDEDFSEVPVDDGAIPESAAPVLEEIEPGATLTPIDFDAEEKNSEAEDVPADPAGSERVPAEADAEAVPPPAAESAPESVPAGTLKVVEAETLERAEDADAAAPARGNYVFPPLDLLAEPKPSSASQDEDYEARGQIIISELANFNCPATLSSAQVGPTITRYEIKPGAGVRAERILNLQNNVAMALQAQSARLASVPEHGTIGIEVPNKKAKPVLIREVLESKAWHENKMEIPAVLGKDVTGKPVLIDLAKMPHGLIAGSSGSGKSVCLNGIITSILYHASPEEVRLVMVDPKVVELKVYNNAPHMLIPVITDMKRAPGALKWLIDEMERRYQLLEEAGVRNIVGYNAKVEKNKAEAARLAELAAASENGDALSGVQKISSESDASGGVPADVSVPRDEGVLDELRGKKKMSYIVCIIDEFGDLMSQNAAEIETSVHRLTAKARAAGIHLILATQRPDAKIVTGLIKANLGTRIALRVTSGTNSRIILDEVGAETLIGKGDMLVLAPGSPFPQRAQGVWVSEEEIEDIVNFLAEKNGRPKYADDVTSAIDSYAAEGEDGDSGGGNGVSDSRDDLVGKAWDVIRTTKKASISNLQRRLGIGYNRAAKIIDILEEQGRIGPELGPNKPREIYE